MQTNLSELKANSSKLNSKKGFTLLELLIVITILAVLSVAVVIIINPAETIKKARDTQRISDLATLKTAISLYTSSVANPFLGSTTANTACQTTQGTNDAASATLVFYSTPTGASTAVSDTALSADTQGTPVNAGLGTQVASTAVGNVDGSGWFKVKFTNIVGGSPISNLPIDPVNDAAFGASDLAAMTNAGLVYRFACAASPLSFELNAQLESTAFTTANTTTGDVDKRATDGGNNSAIYEVGTALNILGASSDF